MSITALRLKRFRGFPDAHISIRPLTVLLGPNSAGKSSFGHALAAMAYAHKVFAAGPQATLTASATDAEDWPVDLGKTSDLRTSGTHGPICVGLTTGAGYVEYGFGGLDRYTDDLLLSHISHPGGDDTTSPRSSVQLTLPSLLGANSQILRTANTISPNLTQIQLTRINEQQWQEGGNEVQLILNGLAVRAVTHLTGTNRVLRGAASDEILSFLANLTYVRANRKRPSRQYREAVGRYQELGFSGEWMPTVLLRKGGVDVTYQRPPQIPRRPSELPTSFHWESQAEKLVDALNYWLAHLELASSVQANESKTSTNAISLRAKPKGQDIHDITEVGFGVSQVLPVLVAGLLQPNTGALIVDLPEAHLHPRPQGAVADFFCSMALSGRTVLVETHSEMFFHRLRLRAAMNPELREKIAVYFIDEPSDGACATPREVGLGFQDEVYWPQGFLQEGWEAENLIATLRERKL